MVGLSTVIWSGVLLDQESYDYHQYTDEACQNAKGYDPAGKTEEDAADSGGVGTNTTSTPPLSPDMRAYCVSLGANQLAQASLEASRMSLALTLLAGALGAVALIIAFLEWVTYEDAGTARERRREGGERRASGGRRKRS